MDYPFNEKASREGPRSHGGFTFLAIGRPVVIATPEDRSYAESYRMTDFF